MNSRIWTMAILLTPCLAMAQEGSSQSTHSDRATVETRVDWSTGEIALTAPATVKLQADKAELIDLRGNPIAPEEGELSFTDGRLVMKGTTAWLEEALVPGTRSFHWVRVGASKVALDLPTLDLVEVQQATRGTADDVLVELRYRGLLPGFRLYVAEQLQMGQPPLRAEMVVPGQSGPIRIVGVKNEGGTTLLTVRLPAGEQDAPRLFVITAVNRDGSRSRSVRMTLRDNRLAGEPAVVVAARPRPVHEEVDVPACEREKVSVAIQRLAKAGFLVQIVDLDNERELDPQNVGDELVVRQGVPAGGRARKGELILLSVNDPTSLTVPASRGLLRLLATVDVRDDLGFAPLQRSKGGCFTLDGIGSGNIGKAIEAVEAGAKNEDEVLNLVVPGDPGISLDPTRRQKDRTVSGALRVTLESLIDHPSTGDSVNPLVRAIAEAADKTDRAFAEALSKGEALEKAPIEKVLDIVSQQLDVRLNFKDQQAALDAWREDPRNQSMFLLDRDGKHKVADNVAVWFIAWMRSRGLYNPAEDLQLLPGSSSSLIALPNKKIDPKWVDKLPAPKQPLAKKGGKDGSIVFDEKEHVLKVPNGPAVKTGTSHPDLVKLPNLKNKSAREAVDTLKDLGLRYKSQMANRLSNADIVVNTVPAANKWVKPGQTVALEVQRKVPNVVGKSFEEARQILEAAKLTFGSAAPQVALQKGDLVSKQRPAAGDIITPGSKVVLTCDRKLPNVVGKGVLEAEAILQKSGFRTKHAKHARHDTVVTQEPRAGEVLSMGDTVLLTLERKAPQLTAHTAEEAVRIVRDHGFGLKNPDELKKPGGLWIIEQDVAAGKAFRMPPDFDADRLRIRLGLGVKVPAVKNEMLDRGLELLKAARLAPEYQNQFNAGELVRIEAQTPLAGSLAAPNTKVKLQLALAATDVPDVRHKKLREAVAILEKKGLKVKVPAGGLIDVHIVYEQRPRAGEKHALDVPVELVPGYQVPELLDIEINQARRILGEVGGKMRIVNGDNPPLEETENADLIGKTLVDGLNPGELAYLPFDQDLVVEVVAMVRATTEIPSFIGDSEAQAAERAANAKLRIAKEFRTVEDDNNAGQTRVTDQSQAAGNKVPLNTEITLTITEYVEGRNTIVPDIIDLSPDDGRNACEDRKLKFRFTIRTVFTNDPDLNNRVIIDSQDPPAGEEVNRGSTVNAKAVRFLFRAEPQPPNNGGGGNDFRPRMVQVPDLINKTVAEAKHLCGSRELHLRVVRTTVVTVPNKNQAKTVIIQQDPPAFRQVHAGSVIEVTQRIYQYKPVSR